MKPTRTLTGTKARKAILDGVNAIYGPVASTFGPQGKNVLLYRTYGRGPRITNDGYTVAECQEPKDIFVRMAAQAFKEACKRTNEKVGDGTTGTAIVGGALYNDAYDLLNEGTSDFTGKKGGIIGVMTLRRNILETAEAVKEAIKSRAKKVESIEELEKIAIVSVENIELGKTIAKIAWEVGVDGFIDTVEGFKGEIETEISTRGFRFPAKVAAKAFENNPAKYEMVAADCPVLITNYELDNASELGQVFQALNKFTSKLIVIAPKFSENVLIQMINASKQGYFIYPVNVPSLRTEQFEDLAIYCDAKFIDKNKGRSIRTVTMNDLGFLEKLVVKNTEAREDATAMGGRGLIEETKTYMAEEEIEVKGKKQKNKVMKEKVISPIQERIDILKAQRNETQGEIFKKLLDRRIASMGSSVGVIRVGDSTQASSNYLKLKIEDAVYACKAALRGGYVRGGGICLKDISETLPENNILKKALSAPYDQIQNSVDGGLEIGEDIIDPMEAVYCAVDHATSVVASLITVDTMTQEVDEPMHGEGEISIAKAIQEFVISNKRHLGQITEGEEEMERDRMGGLTDDERVLMDRG